MPDYRLYMVEVIHRKGLLFRKLGEELAFPRRMAEGTLRGWGSMCCHDGVEFYVPDHISGDDLAIEVERRLMGAPK